MAKKSTFWADFKKFIMRGNVLDMAIGVVIGGAFGKIVTSLVNDIINPFVGIFIKDGSLDTIRTIITEADPEAGTAEVAILWGTWLQTIIDFLITALCIFLILRIVTRVHNAMDAEKIAEEAKAKAEADAAAAAKAEADAKAQAEAAAALAAKQEALEQAQLEQAKLLGEIRDLLKAKE